ncbi:hypothetical protein GOP47_0016545 [Adiantum capillus-veneris]|uniref:Uncharacterized protein n=1 Tax=Adiantum capillus-veneris TaxID=13818 RepID=A0A9D4ZC65_ADICA|nr:hypothetical protein GOP47_0016545 [Adiantum capillus-veneris]
MLHPSSVNYGLPQKSLGRCTCMPLGLEFSSFIITLLFGRRGARCAVPSLQKLMMYYGENWKRNSFPKGKPSKTSCAALWFSSPI